MQGKIGVENAAKLNNK